MKDAWDKFKISSEALKANWPIVLMGLTALSSGIGNITQGLWLTEADETNTVMRARVEYIDETNAAMKEHIEYTNKKYVLPSVLTEKSDIPQVRDSTCRNCIKRVEKLERWHN